MLAELVDEFEKVIAEGTNPQKKHLLRRLAKKVLVHDRRTVEIWYGLPAAPSAAQAGLPNQTPVRTPRNQAPEFDSVIRSGWGWGQPEVWFRIAQLEDLEGV